MPTIELAAGRVHYRVAGPAGGTAPPVVFVHGILVDGELWAATAATLAARRIRSYAPDLPLGSHREPLRPGGERGPRAVARLVLDLLAALDLTDVTLVGNDTGAAICQFLVDLDPSRVGRLVLTNGDAFELFPPPAFKTLFRIAQQPRVTAALFAGQRVTAVRHSPLAYGSLMREPDAAQTARWATPGRTTAGVREDLAGFARAVDPADLVDVGTRLKAFPGPVLLVWGTADPHLPPPFARRLRDAFTDARLVEVPDARMFVPVDAPDRLAEEIAAFAPVASE